MTRTTTGLDGALAVPPLLRARHRRLRVPSPRHHAGRRGRARRATRHAKATTVWPRC